MNCRQTSLWESLLHFKFDEGDDAFLNRLMRETSWSREYSLRAIDGYRRFLMLASEAGHPVTPSKPVDEVWHLHLLYTRSYWDGLCGGVLGKQLHHDPARGGNADAQRYRQQYQQTLQSYRQLFQEEPPFDVWPLTEPEGASTRPRRWWPRWLCSGGMFAIIAGGCAQLTIGGDENPLNYRGPEFLTFYVVLVIVMWLIAAVVRLLMTRTHQRPPHHLTAYEAAYLRGGENGALHAAACTLAARGMLRMRSTVLSEGIPNARSSDPLEDAILSSVGGRLTTPRQWRTRATPAILQIRTRLRSLGLAVPAQRAAYTALICTAIALLAPAMGIAKIAIGISRDRPVGILVALCAVSIVIALVIFARMPRTTSAGRQLLRTMRATHRKQNRSASSSDPAQVGMAVALFGLGRLKNSGVYWMKHVLAPPPQRGGDGGGSSCGSSCGGGGGGGCGGCGGGH